MKTTTQSSIQAERVQPAVQIQQEFTVQDQQEPIVQSQQEPTVHVQQEPVRVHEVIVPQQKPMLPPGPIPPGMPLPAHLRHLAPTTQQNEQETKRRMEKSSS